LPTPDGKAIRLISTRSNQEVRRTEGEADSPAGIAFAADGRTLTSTSRDGVVRVWEVATGKLVRRITGFGLQVWGVALSPDGGVLVAARQVTQEIHLWDVATGRELHAFPGHRTGPLAVAFSADGKAVLTASRDRIQSTPVRDWAAWSLRRWDAATGRELRVTAHDLKGQVYSNTFSADGSRLATLVHDGTLRLWDAEAGRELCNRKVPTTESRVNSGGKVTTYPRAAVSEPVLTADGKTVFAGHAGDIYRWEAATGKELPPLKLPDQRLTNPLPSPDGRFVAVTAFQRRGWRTALLDTCTGQELRELASGRDDSYAHALSAFSPDGRTLALRVGREVALCEVASGRPRGRLSLGGQVGRAVAFSPDGRLLAVGGDGQTALRVWDLTDDRPAGGMAWPGAGVWSLAFSPDGTRLAVAGLSNTALVCDVRALLKERPAARPKVSADDRERWWGELAGADGGRAFRAIGRLAASGPEGVALLVERLKAAPPLDPQRLARLIKALDDDAFGAREKATEELEGLGVRAEAALREALKAGPSAEARVRLERLLGRLKPAPSPELIALRVVEALERNGGPEARATLKKLAKGPAGDCLAEEAKASLARLARRAAKD
jgi:WD40 repeat protein